MLRHLPGLCRCVGCGHGRDGRLGIHHPQQRTAVGIINGFEQVQIRHDKRQRAAAPPHPGKFPLQKTRVGWQLNAEAGGKAYTLAWGMDKITTHGLLTDVETLLSKSPG